MSDFHIMAVPGGFPLEISGSGRLMGNRLRFGMREQVREFIQNGGLAIGICNDFKYW